MKIHTSLLLCLVLILFQGNIINAYGIALNEEIENVKPINEKCFKCHGQKKYFFYNPETDRIIKERMCADRVIKANDYYTSNHRTFECTTCHSEEYSEFPHPGKLRLEEKFVCIDCHGGDDDWAHYKFDEIEEEFHKSVHATAYDEAFSCWMCHDPHTYKITLRRDSVISNIIAYDNSICLSCHSNIDEYQLLTDKINPNILETHEWIPNQALHFRHVRCIECHVEIREDILVGHNILPKEKAINNCVECHSSNTRLLSTLYKFKQIKYREESGFLNSVMVTETFVIGANRYPFLNKWSIIVFLLVVSIILIHSVIRIILVKR